MTTPTTANRANDSATPLSVLFAKERESIPEPGLEEKIEAARLACRAFSRAGITSVHTCSELDFAPYQRLREENGLSVRVYFNPPLEVFEHLTALGLSTGFGDPWLRFGAVKLFVDGSMGGETAALLEPYEGGTDNYGCYMQSAETFKENVWRVHSAGCQVAVHTIGDGAVEMALEAFEEAQRRMPRLDPRHYLIHCQAMHPGHFERMRRLGMIAAVQPIFIRTDMRWAEELLGPERMRTAYAWRTFLESGVRTTGGSDAPVEPPNPIYGIYTAVTRKNLEGEPEGGWYPEQKLDVEQALAMFTREAAYASHEEHLKGTLTPGKLADLVVLSRDLMACPSDEIKDITVDAAMAGGRWTHEQKAIDA